MVDDHDTLVSSVRKGGPGDVESAVGILTEAFMAEESTRWLFPDDAERQECQQYYYLPLAGQVAADGGLLMVEDKAASLWMPVTGEGTSGPDFGAVDLPPALAAHTERLTSLLTLLGERHPRGQRYLHVSFMGVRPGDQGRGLGSALLRQGLAEADAAGLGVYLETASAGARALFERHGFQAACEPVRLPDGPDITTLWRPAAR
ncbi:ribosomal protein S18 acetylase RimI-like enzyme [Actinoalloteichus hoggarensis]|uniref:Mycothiol acetyltransferase n=1 Tax=Actinoalloteichus hoggarensis TaxID=1470176 RepID=A0A221W4Y0_9PSEU|nr:GNAT family N-acetyltransferase [Actinoalloteichus hoggarensis]ASO20908.1 Mycothiol acetyltransferase [Actinoalloteichus hoggarensis]MBB5920838.1 ribosomal protein S18 acetylase RimI-like enzyme [Actinoalloteichus hoggarensis]